MRRLVLALLLSLLYEPIASGQAPDILRHYRLLPRHSFVRETGGFAGFDNLYRARGEFDFLRLWNDGRFSAQFDDAEIWGSQISDDPVIAIVLDVDEVFNLEGLRGELIPSLNPFADIYRFKGEAPDSSYVDLYAFQAGPWMYLHGSTNPPPDVADFVEYEIRALARTRPWADANDDGIVNLADYTVIRDNLGTDVEGPSFSDWRQQFGEVLPDMEEMESAMFAAMSSSRLSTAAIPEPTAAWLVLGGAVCSLAARRMVGRSTGLAKRNGWS